MGIPFASIKRKTDSIPDNQKKWRCPITKEAQRNFEDKEYNSGTLSTLDFERVN